MEYELNLSSLRPGSAAPLGENFRDSGPRGETAWTDSYMTRDGIPCLGVSGEFHFSRMEPWRWEDELLKMKMGGITAVSTYVFWIHHEEQENVFRFDGRRDLRRFVDLCGRHDLDVILRIGPFCHGEVRNGGLPDWLYGKPYEVRGLDPGFLSQVRKLYAAIEAQVRGLFFRDGGPVLAVQIDNEYMHSSAPWEMTVGVTDEWVPGGGDGVRYMLALRDIALECGFRPAFFTCTAWGGAAAPEEMLPLWGGYPWRPWIFPAHQGEHPATEMYVYQDYRSPDAVCTDDFQPSFRSETRPYACCEMGGGMTCSYRYRFRLPWKSADALANIKLGSGCSFLGWYMFHGGTNPVGTGIFLNENQMPRISYDYQAPLGEYGQARPSYHRLRCLHLFVRSFGERLCRYRTVLPEGASRIDPKDPGPLRFAVRTDGRSGFLFLNNFQDHFDLPDRTGDTVTLHLSGGDVTWDIALAREENAILPFHMDLDGIDLVQACAQCLTRLVVRGIPTYVFFVPDGMRGSFVFEEGAGIGGEAGRCRTEPADAPFQRFSVEKAGRRVHVLVLSREFAERMYVVRGGRLVFTPQILLEDWQGLRLETGEAWNHVLVYPPDGLTGTEPEGLLGRKVFRTEERDLPLTVRRTGPFRYVLSILLPEELGNIKDVILEIGYTGDIASAFLDGQLISDNFWNGAPWEIGLGDHFSLLRQHPLVICIVPRKEGVTVEAESPMAGRMEKTASCRGGLECARLRPVFQIPVS